MTGVHETGAPLSSHLAARIARPTIVAMQATRFPSFTPVCKTAMICIHYFIPDLNWVNPRGWLMECGIQLCHTEEQE